MKNKGFLICFAGIDGSGKSTVAKKLTNYLKDEKNLPVRYVYGRIKPFFTKPLMFIGNKIFLRNHSITENYIEYTIKKKTLFNHHKFIQTVYLYALLVDYLLQLLIKIKIPLILGKIVISDRYIYDTIITDVAVDMNFSEKQITSLLNRCFLLIPKPAISFIVDVQEDVAYLRKDDVPDKEYLKDRRSLYLEVARYYDLVILNGNNKPYDVLTDCIKRLENDFNL